MSVNCPAASPRKRWLRCSYHVAQIRIGRALTIAALNARIPGPTEATIIRRKLFMCTLLSSSPL